MPEPMNKEEQARRKKKTESLRTLAGQIHKLRRKLTKDMKSDDEKTRLTALAISIMDKTAERVGNESSAKEGHVGVTGFKNNQVSVDGNTITLKYTGKSGVKQEKQFSDKLIAKLLGECKGNCKGDNSPVMVTSDGFKLKADKVNRYLKEFDITAKDIRGYAANTLVVKALKGAKKSSDPDERKKKFREVLKAVAQKVGHQQATLKMHYLLPGVEEAYVKSGTIKNIKNASSDRIASHIRMASHIRIAEDLVVENMEYYDMAWQAVWEAWPEVVVVYEKLFGARPTLHGLIQIGINDWDLPFGKVGSYMPPKVGEAYGILTISPGAFTSDKYEIVIKHELIHAVLGVTNPNHGEQFVAMAEELGIPPEYQD